MWPVRCLEIDFPTLVNTVGFSEQKWKEKLHHADIYRTVSSQLNVKRMVQPKVDKKDLT